MSDRPPIPAGIAREVLVESGHRCAVCGEPCPLQLAHIIPWRESRDHRAEDLICLCASCHQRADKEKWGERTLREYKQKPWVSRKHDTGRISLPGDKMELEVTVEKPVDVSNEEAAKWLKDAFAAYLDTAPENVRVRLIVTASVKVTIELSARAAESLLAACQSNDPNLARHLEPLVLVSIQRLRTIPELPWFRWALVSALASATYFALASATYFALVVAVYWVVGGGRWGEFIAIWACLWPLAAAVILARDTDQWLLRVVMVFFAVLFCVMCVLWFGSVVAALFTGVALSAIVLVVTVRMTS